MSKRGWVVTFIIFGLAIIIYVVSKIIIEPKPVQVELIGDLPYMTFDEMIYGAELILVGEVEEILPSKWNTTRKINTKWLNKYDVHNLGVGMYTDVVVAPKRFIKGILPDDSVLRVRSYIGQIEHVTFNSDKERIFQKGQIYLLFLSKDYLSENPIDPGYYRPRNGAEGTFLIDSNVAVSKWGEKQDLDEMIAYIEDSRWALPAPNIPEVEKSQEIIETLDHMYDIETKAGFDFFTEDFSSVFISDSRFTLLPEKVEYTKYFTDVPSRNLFGYLDYKIAYYNWWRNGVLQYEAIQAKAASENREISSEELQIITGSEWAKKWGLPSVREEGPVREHILQVTSIEIGNEFTTVYLFDSYKLVELYLVKSDGRWYVAGEKDVTTKPDVLTEKILPEETSTIMP